MSENDLGFIHRFRASGGAWLAEYHCSSCTEPEATRTI